MKITRKKDNLYIQGYINIKYLIISVLVILISILLIFKFALSSNNANSNVGETISTATDGKYFDYEDLNNNEISITAYSDDAPKNVVIPSKIDGKKVICIDKYAFADMDLLNVIIPNTVKTIKDSAFLDNKLTDLKIPDSVTYIGEKAFASNWIKKVTIGRNVSTIQEEAFFNNRIPHVTIHEGTNIKPHSFDRLTTIKGNSLYDKR